MGQNRFNLSELVQPVPVQAAVAVAGFVAVPACLMGPADVGSCQNQLYQWAYRQAQAAIAARPARLPDLFAVFN